MTVKGHIVLASTLAYLPVEYMNEYYSFTESILVYLLILFGALLPDIDEPKSYIGNKLTYFAQFLKLMGLKHRTVTHWLITPLLIALVGYFLLEDIEQIIILSIAFGILAHDIGDLLTKGGIDGFFYPLFPQRKIVLLPRFLRFKTFSIQEMMIIAALVCVNIYIYSLFLKELV